MHGGYSRVVLRHLHLSCDTHYCWYCLARNEEGLPLVGLGRTRAGEGGNGEEWGEENWVADRGEGAGEEGMVWLVL